METKVCYTCKNSKTLSEFGNNRSNSDGKQGYCKECGRTKDKRHYKKSDIRKHKIKEARTEAKTRNHKFVIQYLLSHPCVDCGESNPLILDFDHHSDKVLDVGTMVCHGWSVEKISEEIEKCDVRCVKCHRIQTAKKAGWYDSYMAMVSECVNTSSPRKLL